MNSNETKTEKKDFPRIRREVMKEAAQRIARASYFIAHGYNEDTPREEKVESLRGVEYYGGRKLRESVECGEITKEEAIRATTEKEIKAIEKSKNRKLKELDEIAREGCKKIENISILIEWKKSRTWGYNPHAYINIYGNGFFEHYEGTASGCGYDKRSAAVAQALNQSNTVLYCLCCAEEKRLGMRKLAGKDTSRRAVLGYGSGYGELPKFEGGVGIESHRHIFITIGFSWDNGAFSDTVDTYTIRRR